jgi:magnesium transporter
MSSTVPAPSSSEPQNEDVVRVSKAILEQSPKEAVQMLEKHPDTFIEQVLQTLNPGTRQNLLDCFPRARRELILAAAPPEHRRQWLANDAFPEDSLGRLMEPPLAVFGPEVTIAEATERLRVLVSHAFITYGFVVDDQERLLGVVAMREMLLGRPDQRLEEIMFRDPFALKPEMNLTEAMKATVTRHFPVYPVCDSTGRLIGLVRGQMLFEAQAIELSAQPGAMVGVEREERLATPWTRSLKFRHPWLQLNLVTAFVAAAVVGIFEGTLEKIVLLAVFLPVLAGQSGNTGCQALAVTLRGITLGELTPDRVRSLVGKEALLGLCNGALVGVSAGLGMLVYASMQKHPNAIMLSIIVWMAMICSCVISGVSGALVPLTLKRFGADPATASSIFLTTATDVVSMGTFLGLATLLIR